MRVIPPHTHRWDRAAGPQYNCSREQPWLNIRNPDKPGKFGFAALGVALGVDGAWFAGEAAQLRRSRLQWVTTPRAASRVCPRQ